METQEVCKGTAHLLYPPVRVESASPGQDTCAEALLAHQLLGEPTCLWGLHLKAVRMRQSWFQAGS